MDDWWSMRQLELISRPSLLSIFERLRLMSLPSRKSIGWVNRYSIVGLDVEPATEEEEDDDEEEDDEEELLVVCLV